MRAVRQRRGELRADLFSEGHGGGTPARVAHERRASATGIVVVPVVGEIAPR